MQNNIQTIKLVVGLRRIKNVKIILASAKESLYDVISKFNSPQDEKHCQRVDDICVIHVSGEQNDCKSIKKKKRKEKERETILRKKICE